MKTFGLLVPYIILALLLCWCETTTVIRRTSSSSGGNSEEENACVNISAPSSGKACSVGALGGKYRCCLVKLSEGGVCRYVEDKEKALKELSKNNNNAKIDCGKNYIKAYSVSMLMLCVLLLIY